MIEPPVFAGYCAARPSRQGLLRRCYTLRPSS